MKEENIQPNYKNIQYYDTKKMPKKQNGFARFIIYLLSKVSLIGTKYKIEKIDMEGLKPPYLLLSNHMYFVDFYINSIATFPHGVNNIATVDGYYKRPKLMEFLGCICTRKFTNDIALIKQMKYCKDKYKSIISMYPEARYSPIGTKSILPEALGKLAKILGVPVVVLINHGNYLSTPFWNFKDKRKVPLHATMKQILTKEQIEEYDANKINEIINKEFEYDEYKWQKENKIEIKDRTEGINKVLYKCPNCNAEDMSSDSEKLWCNNCHKEWKMNEYGELYVPEGETEFTHVPSWFEWEREQVRQEIINDKYCFEDIVYVYSLPNPKEFINLGQAKLLHDKNGFTLEGEFSGEKYKINKLPLTNYGIHVEYDYVYIKPYDCIDISTNEDSFYCYPTKKNVITKISLAVEELYKLNKREIKHEE